MIISSSDLFPLLCQATGKCCIHNIVILSSFDIFRMAKSIGVSAKELFQKKILTYRINPSTYWMEPIINTRTSPACPFLFREIETEKYLCEIYESRPLVCRIYPLKYDKDDDVFMRFLPAENRCYECITDQKNVTLDDYLSESEVPYLLSEFRQYLSVLDTVLEKGFSLQKIKKNKIAQKKFFEIQALLYETYPSKNIVLDTLPFDVMKSSINSIIES